MKEAIKEAAAAVKAAQKTRKKHAKKSALDSPDRLAELEEATSRLKAAMAPLRSASGRFQFEPQSQIAEDRRDLIRLASLAIQKERIKLWKMTNASKKAIKNG